MLSLSHVPLNAATLDFIRQHSSDDVRQLALRRVPAEVDLRAALQQIEGRQLAARKLPACAATDGLLFPPRLSLEQCSSEATAAYKRDIVALGEDRGGLPSLFVDLTAGFGIDFVALAPLFSQSLYIDSNPDLCTLARHNLPLLGLPTAEVRCSTAEAVLSAGLQAQLIMIDPARRNVAGRKVALIEECTPDVCALQNALCASARYVLIKLSPMLDIAAALRALRRVKEVHVVSVANECKELLFLLDSKTTVTEPTITCVNLPASPSAPSLGEGRGGLHSPYHFTRAEEASEPPVFAESIGTFLYEPNASILKAGAFRTPCHRFAVSKLSKDAHLYTSDHLVPDFPGRIWRVIDTSSFSKKSLRTFLADMKEADITVRGFPLSAKALRQQLRLQEGGSNHLIATTLSNGERCLVKVCRAEKIR